MKLPRWLVVSVLVASLAMVLVTAASWWVTWPERTARMFVDRAGVGDVRAAAALFRRPDRAPLQPEGAFWIMPADETTVPYAILPNPPMWTLKDMEPVPRSWAEVLSCEQRFDLPPFWRITVRRGMVIELGGRPRK